MSKLEWLRTTLDCGDNSCLFIGPEQRKGMRTNGGCRCFKTLPQKHRIYVNKLFHTVVKHEEALTISKEQAQSEPKTDSNLRRFGQRGEIND